MNPHPLFEAIKANDAAAVARVLEEQPQLKARLDEPVPGGAFGQTALLAAVERGNREMVDVLLRGGANINQKSHWWAGGFHVLDDAWRAPWLASFLIGRGAVLEIHHAVRLGMLEEVRRMLSQTPGLVHARGGDGQTPLHFAQTVEMAEFLLARGADIDARDIDHESTPAQWMVRDRQEVARFLVNRGATTDLLLASALGDRDAVTRLLDADPGSIAMAVDGTWFPKRDPRAGGTIYIWTLGANRTAPLVAREFTHDDVFELLMARAPDTMQLAVACELGDEALSARLRAARPDLAATLPPREQRRLADAAQHNNVAAVRMMLEAGWPIDARGQHGATALHWAAYQGNAEMAGVLLAHGAPLDATDADFSGTPLGWARHAEANAGSANRGDYAATIAMLRAAGGEAP